MNTIDCFAMGMATLGEEMRVFDWDKAARIIKERNPNIVEAGLKEDWSWTGGEIWENGAEAYNPFVYLGLTWATPVLKIDGETIPCWKMESETPEWDADTLWPESAIMILHSLEGGTQNA